MAIHLPRKPENAAVQNRYRGCLLGGAVGDALGAPVEFLSLAQIEQQFGSAGIQEYVPAFSKLGAITDDTQMTLFTAEGALRAWVREVARGLCHPPSIIALAYQRWLHTQGVAHPLHSFCLDGWLLQHEDLFSRRAPGMTCLSGLQAMEDSSSRARNNSKGCGGVMRVAPIGMVFATIGRQVSNKHDLQLAECFSLASEAASVTHGHATGQLASGAFAVITMQLLLGASLLQALATAQTILATHPGHEETSSALLAAEKLAANKPGSAIALQTLGGGWVAEEALAIAIYSALSTQNFRNGVALAVNHGGDSDSTGSIAGQLLGAMLGADAIPTSWLEPLELRSVLEEVADDLACFTDWQLDGDDEGEFDFYFVRYPGC